VKYHCDTMNMFAEYEYFYFAFTLLSWLLSQFALLVAAYINFCYYLR